jgi:aspartyl protease family protein
MNHPDDQGNRRIGKGMIIAAWLLGFGMLFVYFSYFMERERNPNQSLSSHVDESGVIEVYLKRNRYGHYVTNGQINGTDVEFMLDTGASDVAVPAQLANKLGLVKGVQRRYQTANGTVIAYSTMLDSVSVGPIRLQGVRASINPGLKGSDVLLGMSALRQVEFTQRGDTLILRTIAGY